jgi:hypothetical protein
MVGQLVVDMFLQVLIERERRLHDGRDYVKSFLQQFVQRSTELNARSTAEPETESLPRLWHIADARP